MIENPQLVYSSDPKKNILCPKCKRLMLECLCRKEAAPVIKNFCAVLRIEKSGRSGKTVTVIDQLPRSENFLKDLAKKLKSRCGSGGTYRMEGPVGLIEIQGDQRDRIRELLNKEGIRVKGS